MIPSPAKLGPSLVESWKGRARERAKRAEARLELAFTWGVGHVLVTGFDRAETRDLLERVLGRVDALGTVRAQACSPDPESALNEVVALCTEREPTPGGRRERREALVRTVDEARSAGRSIFVVVDDGDEATVEQLERLRAGVEVTPEALERLRLVFLGGPTLVAKLQDRRARALSSRIGARISLGRAHRGGQTAVGAERPPSRAIAIAAGVSFALVAALGVHVLFPGSSQRDAPADVDVASSSATHSWTTTGSAEVTTGLRGDEPFLRRPLQIAIQEKWTTGSALFPPPNPAVATRAGPPAEVPAHASGPTPAPLPQQGAASVVAAAPAPLKVSTELPAGTSIATLVERFR
jgi:hypothetical protein